MSDYLLPVADRDALRWIVREQRTALPAHRRLEAERTQPSDRIFLYATRGCFRNPRRDRGRIFGVAEITRPAETLRRPVIFGDRSYNIGLDFQIELLARMRTGVELAPLVSKLATFPDKASWSARLRRALVPLARGDASILLRELRKVALPYPAALDTYE